MLPFCPSLSLYVHIWEKSFAYSMLRMYLFEIMAAIFLLSLFKNFCYLKRFPLISLTYIYAHTNFDVFLRFIWTIVSWNINFFINDFSKFISSHSNSIINGQFYTIQVKPSILSPSSKKNINKTPKYEIKINQVKSHLILGIVFLCLITMLTVNFHYYFETINKRKQNISMSKQLLQYSKKDRIFSNLAQLFGNGIILGTDLGCENEITGQGRSYLDENINISNCFFSRSSEYSGDGGVIYVNSGFYSMNISYSMFYNCFCSLKGGAIFFSSSNSYLRMICANSCLASSYYHFSHLKASFVNHLEYLSLSNCSHSSCWYSVDLDSGNQKVENTNSSMNNALWASGIAFQYTSSSMCSFCTFSNNEVSYGICIYLYSTSGTISISYANIVENNSPSLGVVFVDGGGSRKMMNCIFQNNQNYLLCVATGSLEVSHSFIGHSIFSFSFSKSVSCSQNNSFSYQKTYQIQFFKSIFCNAQFPVPVPSPVSTVLAIQTPNKTHDDTPMRSFEITIVKTNIETLRMTFERTVNSTIIETPINTHDQTLMNTQEKSPINTLEETLRISPERTIHRSYAECDFSHQMTKKSKINVIFSLSLLIQ